MSGLFVVALALACALLAAAAPAQFTARVTKVVDGDSLWVAKSASKQVEVRLVAIDSPERDQPYGDRSRADLAELVAGRDVRVVSTGVDEYGRVLGRVFVGERDVNAELVRRGAAWVYRHYTKDPKLLALEGEARAAHRGLWALPEAERIPPWDWRHRAHGECGTKHSCREMKSCAEARFYLEKCGVETLDGDGDGVPCARLCRR